MEEFEKMKGGSELVEDEEEEQWYNEFRQKEQLRKEQAREVSIGPPLCVLPRTYAAISIALQALSELSRKVAAITDPRLRRSNFMKFLGKLGSGELVVEGDRVVEGPARPTESWVSEFRQQEAPDDWAVRHPYARAHTHTHNTYTLLVSTALSGNSTRCTPRGLPRRGQKNLRAPSMFPSAILICRMIHSICSALLRAQKDTEHE